MKPPRFATFLILITVFTAHAQVTVTFRHYPTSAAVQRCFVPGSFNNWGPNSSGVIAATAPSLMTFVDSLGCYVKSYRFAAGEMHNYKFHEHLNSGGTLSQWLSDPLNPEINTADNNNAILRVEPAMLFQIYPGNGSLVTTHDARLCAGVFVSETDSLLAAESTISLDGQVVATFDECFIPTLNLLSWPLAGLANGNHTALLHLKTRSGRSVVDSTRFTLLGGPILFMTPSCDSVWAASKSVRWRINADPATIQSAAFAQIGKSPVGIATKLGGEYERAVTLTYGDNRFVTSFTTTQGVTQYSDTLMLRYPLPQKPIPGITLTLSGDKIKISGSAQDPQRTTMTFSWSSSVLNPAVLPGLPGSSETTLEIDPPTVPGDYGFKLTVTDADGFSGTAAAFFTIAADGSVILPGSATVPQWVRDARIYCLFFKSFSAAGTIAEACASLPYIRDLGFNTIWVLPVMDVEGVINQGSNVGYNIIDFYTVEPAYGANADFKYFVEQAHAQGLRVILDVTPNHSSRSHPFALDARTNRKYSRYYDFYQHDLIPHDTNGLGQSFSADGIVYYSAFSDALLNWNWADAEARLYMIEVYKHWLREYDIDGFRFDVWWGPHRRYGVNTFDKPLRTALRNVKSDILLLGETAGTGAGTEDNYADRNGGMDMGYDWSLFGALNGFPAPATLHARLYNDGYRPGPNSFFLRFLENHDEERVIHRYGSAERTIPVSTALFTSTGTPLLYAGEEVGMGLGGATLDARRRGTINWSAAAGAILTPHYQKLAHIRAQFPAFRTQLHDSNGDGQINSSDVNVQRRLDPGKATSYVLARPWRDANGMAVMNFAATTQEIVVALQPEVWMDFSTPFQSDRVYYLNDLYADVSTALPGAHLDTLRLTLPPWGVAVYTIATEEQHVTLPELIPNGVAIPASARPQHFDLLGSYPNPFNSGTRIRFVLAKEAEVAWMVFNARGQRLVTGASGRRAAGVQEWFWDGRDASGRPCPSGIYFVRLQSGNAVVVQKMALVR